MISKEYRKAGYHDTHNDNWAVFPLSKTAQFLVEDSTHDSLESRICYSRASVPSK